MSRSITLDEQHFQAMAEKARALGKTPEEYLQGLIDADARTFDEVLAPMRKVFESTPDDELDALFERARKAVRDSK